MVRPFLRITAPPQPRENVVQTRVVHDGDAV